MTRDLDLAEDLAQDALVAALEQWPDRGVPSEPRRLADGGRQAPRDRPVPAQRHPAPSYAELAHGLEEAETPDLDAAVDHIEDDVLRLAFLCCHPALPPESRAALTLRLVGGLTTPEIARAYLVKDATMGQRISRAKRLLAESGATLEMPAGAERRAAARRRDGGRLPDLQRGVRRDRRARTGPAPTSAWRRCGWPGSWPTSRRTSPRCTACRRCSSSRARGCRRATTPTATAILLEAQDRRRWDQLLIRPRPGRAGPRGGAGRARAAGRHLRAPGRDRGLPRPGPPPRGHRLGRDRRAVRRARPAAPGPVVEVNRAVAHGRAFGPDAGLAVLDAVAGHPAVAASHLVPAVRGDLLERAGRHEEAAAAFRDAAALTRNAAERRILIGRADANVGARVSDGNHEPQQRPR